MELSYLNPIEIKAVFCPPLNDGKKRYEELVHQIVDVEGEDCGYAQITVEVDSEDYLVIRVGGKTEDDLQISLPCGPLRRLMREASEYIPKE